MMCKNLVVIAVSALLAVPVVAQAGVEVYGQGRISLGFNSNNSPSPSTACSTAVPPVATDCEDSAFTIASHASRLGFRGEEDIGGGVKVVWQLEQQFDFDSGLFGAVVRNSFVGLSGEFGKVLAGKHDTPLRTVTQRLNILADSWGDYNSIIGNLAGVRVFDQRSDNSLTYISPDLQGFGFSAAYSASRKDDDLPVTKIDGGKNVVSVSGSYSNGPLYLGAGFESLGNYTGTDDASAVKLGGSWTWAQATTLAGVWERADKGGVNGERDAWYVSLAHKVGANTFKTDIAGAGELGSLANTGALQYTLAWTRMLTKATEVYVLYTMLENDAAGTYGLWTGTQAIPGYPGNSVSSLSVGLNHRFSSK